MASSSSAFKALLAALFAALLVGVANGIRLQEKGKTVAELHAVCFTQHPYKQQLVIAVKFYILLLKAKNKQHTKKRLV